MADRFQTERELRRIIEECLGAGLVFSTIMTSFRDHADEPALSIAISMKSAKDIPGAAAQSELTRKLRVCLADSGDVRYPYLYFDALDLDNSPDDVDENESLPEVSERL